MKGYRHVWFLLVLVLLLVCGAGVLYLVQSQIAVADARRELGLHIADVEERIERNERMVRLLRYQSDAQSIAKARAFAYMIEQEPSILLDPVELERVRRLLDVDELHVADRRGILVASTIPPYVGYDYASDPQSAVFLLAIEYSYFELAQPPQPKGINKEMFQYIGVSRLDEPGIVQVGYRPEHLYEAIAAADIARVAEATRVGRSGGMVITDLDGLVVSAGNEDAVGRPVDELGIRPALLRGESGGFSSVMDGEESLVCYKVFEEYIIIGWMPFLELFGLGRSQLVVFVVLGVLLLVLPGYLVIRKTGDRLV